jgi:hypothetical protein
MTAITKTLIAISNGTSLLMSLKCSVENMPERPSALWIVCKLLALGVSALIQLEKAMIRKHTAPKKRLSSDQTRLYTKVYAEIYVEKIVTPINSPQ